MWFESDLYVDVCGYLLIEVFCENMSELWCIVWVGMLFECMVIWMFDYGLYYVMGILLCGVFGKLFMLFVVVV